MDYTLKFNSIKTFLKPYSTLWSEEILDRYPDCLHNKSPYILELIKLGTMDLLKVENLQTIGNPLLDPIITEVQNLIAIPKLSFISEELEETKRNFTRMNQKKIHEVSQISKYLKSEKLGHIIDIGGGVGHLCQHLIQYNQATATSIDMNQELQDKGAKRISRLYPEVKDKIAFENIEVDKSNLNNIFDKSIQRNSKLLGLHSCGELSNHLIDLFINSEISSFINIGCCYHKIDKEINLSKESKFGPLEISNQAKTLATRTYKKLTLVEFQKREAVKRKRYALQILLYNKFGIREFVGVGNAKIIEYEKPFSDYATKKLAAIEFDHNLSAKELNDFYKDKVVQDEITFMLRCGIFRSLFARPIELYIILDRAMYLEDHGHKTEMVEIFDNAKSPRNIAISSSRE
jgi:hypothetical protein